MLTTPRVARNIEGAHSLKDRRTLCVADLDWDAREPSTLEAFRIAQMGAAAASDWYRLVLRDSHVVEVFATSLRVLRRHHLEPAWIVGFYDRCRNREDPWIG